MKSRFAAIGLLLLLAWLELSTLAVTSPTVDEPLHIMRGAAYMRRDEERYLMYGPVLPNALSGLGLLAKPDLQLYPNDDPITSTLDALQAAAHPPRYLNADDTYALVQWLDQNVTGLPVLLEATDDGSETRPASSRISSWTGLPTVLSWYELETQWRGSDAIQRQGLPDITTIYSTTDEDAARLLLQRYAVACVLVGDRERKQYPAAG